MVAIEQSQALDVTVTRARSSAPVLARLAFFATPALWLMPHRTPPTVSLVRRSGPASARRRTLHRAERASFPARRPTVALHRSSPRRASPRQSPVRPRLRATRVLTSLLRRQVTVPRARSSPPLLARRPSLVRRRLLHPRHRAPLRPITVPRGAPASAWRGTGPINLPRFGGQVKVTGEPPPWH
jgi:hypothetical protein